MAYEKLMKACGGRINPETLVEFAAAMREYEEFMSGMREMFAPVEFKCNGRRFATEEMAKEYASGFFETSGVVLGIEKVRA